MCLETPARIEPALLDTPSARVADVIAEISADAATLGRSLHPSTARELAALVRIMNTYYSNLIEGHDTRPRDIERALAGDLDPDEGRRNLQIEARAHMRVQAEIERRAADNTLPHPASREFIQWLHAEFYRDAPEAMLRIGEGDRAFIMVPGAWRSRPEHDNAVGRHVPPSSARVADFMAHFEQRYRLDGLGAASRILAIPAAHHRLAYIHPFPDGNGRVARLMSHAMALKAGIGAHGLWSISRGLACGLESRTEYKSMLDLADTPRRGDLDGRGNLSESALEEFCFWFLQVCRDQIRFMSGLFEINTLSGRLARIVEQSNALKPEAARLLNEALMRGEFERGEAERITGLPERSARRVLASVMDAGLMGSGSARGPVSLRFPSAALDVLFPRLYPVT